MSKAKVEERPTVLLGRPSNNVSIGIVGMPNIGKCFAPDTLIRLYDGSTLPVQHISSLTPLMGDDGLPRLVTPGSLVSGRARMYTVTPQWDGMAPFTVNGDHILVLHCKTRPSLRAEADGAYTVSWMEVSTDNSASRVEVRHATLEAAQAELAALMAQQGPLEWEVSVDDFLATSPSVSSHFHVIASAAVTFHSATQPTLAHTLTGFLGVAPSAAQEEWAAWYLGHWLTAGAADSECIELEGDAGLEGISSRVAAVPVAVRRAGEPPGHVRCLVVHFRRRGHLLLRRPPATNLLQPPRQLPRSRLLAVRLCRLPPSTAGRCAGWSASGRGPSISPCRVRCHR